MMLMGYWSCAVQPGTAMTAHGDDEVRRHKGCRTFLLRPRAPRPSDPELPHAEANLPTRYPTHRKQRGGARAVIWGLTPPTLLAVVHPSGGAIAAALSMVSRQARIVATGWRY